MSQNADRRQYPRLSTGVTQVVSARALEKSSQRYLEGVIANVGLGGMFLETDQLFAKGTQLTLEFKVTTPEGRKAIRAKAIVRWTNRLVRRGMGLEFFEFEGVGRDDLRAWLDRLAAGPVPELHPSPRTLAETFA